MPDVHARDLDRRILAWIREPADEESFELLASDLFRYQYEHNPPYRAYCNAIEIGPRDIQSWREIPPIPTSAFKNHTLTCFPPGEIVKTFQTSGTTVEDTGRHQLLPSPA